MTVWAVVVAAGSGTRFGGSKQFATLCGKPMVAWSVEAARAVCDGVVVVVPAGAAGAVDGADVVVAGGATRSESVRAGLAAVPAGTSVIAVHDAARPLATSALFDAVVDVVHSAGAVGAVPGVAVHDTVKRVTGGVVVATVDRSELVAVQTPQAFTADVLRLAHASGGGATDDAALVEALGLVVRVVPGEATNLKVTTAVDLHVAEVVLQGRLGRVPGGGVSGTARLS